MFARRSVLLMVLGALAAFGSAPALAIQAGITLDIHQDILDQALWPNDFHIQGLICSNDGTVPVVISHIDGPFTNFTCTITKMPGDDCWYWFEATWWLPPGIYIPYCNVIHLGLLFDVDAANVIIDLIGWWTRNGVPVGQIMGNLLNGGYVPLMGFNVADTGSPQIITIGNGDIPITPPLPEPLPPLPPWPPSPFELQVMQMDVLPFPPGMPPNLADLSEFGPQQSWPWVPVVYPDGQPINPGRPLPMAPDSFFDVFLESFGRGGGFRPLFPTPIEPGGFLVARQLVQFINNHGLPEQRWFWEIHGAQPTEACCFLDGHCEDLVPFNCLQKGGQPMGPGTLCAQTICPMVELGACCYGTAAPQCIITDQITCEQQFLGIWKGPGTNCDDLNGNGVADICEIPVQRPEACCLPDGSCLMLLVPDCLQMGGVPKGIGSHCLGDLDGNGVDDICEAKWLQLPDLSVRGIDVRDTLPLVLADDFLCTQRGLITDIIVWGSWRHDILPPDPTQVRFTLSFHEDIPATPETYSRPGVIRWVQTFPPGSFTAMPYQGNIQEGWWDPRDPQSYEFPGDTVCWMYRFQVPPNMAFCQEGNPDQPKVYWLDVQAEPLGATVAQFGWKTSINHWNDDAVWGMGPEPYPGPWQELRYPPGHELQGQSIDLAFALSGNLPCPPPVCIGDLNCDGQVDFRDINPFVLYLANFPLWQTTYPGCNPQNGDINGDGLYPAFSDINPFVALLANNPLPIPCP